MSLCGSERCTVATASSFCSPTIAEVTDLDAEIRIEPLFGADDDCRLPICHVSRYIGSFLFVLRYLNCSLNKYICIPITPDVPIAKYYGLVRIWD
jgi:hypothetical protein